MPRPTPSFQGRQRSHAWPDPRRPRSSRRSATSSTDADAAVLTEYRGLTVGELAELRGALRPAGTEYKVFKNTLARRAAEAAGLAELVPMLEGPVAIAFVHGDAVIAAKALRDFGQDQPRARRQGRPARRPRARRRRRSTALADVQPREVLLARLAGGFQAPLVKAAGLFQAFTRNFAYGVKAYVDQRVEGGEALAGRRSRRRERRRPRPRRSRAGDARGGGGRRGRAEARAAKPRRRADATERPTRPKHRGRVTWQP